MTDSVAKTTEEWVFVARSIGELTDSQVQAMRCMVMAGIAAESVSDWVVLARSWTQDFDDNELAWQCMAKAEADAEDSGEVDDWTLVGDMWAEMGFHNKAVEIAREQFEPMEWPYLAELERASGELPAGTTSLDWIEPGMTGRAARDLVERVNEETGAGYTDIAHTLLSAERFADNTRDWTLIAKAWLEKLQNSEEAKRCMGEAEDAIDIRHDRVLIAMAWKEHFNDLQAAIRFIVHELGVLTGPALTDINSWDPDCESDRKKGHCAEHYSFTLSEPGEITITLTSDEEDAVLGLFLISGDTFAGEVLEEAGSEVANDDDDFDEPYTLSRIRRSLASGAYTVEATSDLAIDFRIDIALSNSA